jgi:alpha-1,3-rhamnosyl/mannosyltransferase
VVTVHDLIPVLFPEPRVPPWRRAASRLLLTHAVRRAVRVVAVSRCTADDLRTHLGVESERIDVVPPGIHPRYRPLPAAAIEDFRRRAALPERFILWVGLRRPHKNVERLVRAYGRYRANAAHPVPSLVLWGRPDERDRAVERAIDALELGRVVQSADRRISDDDMPLLYGAATAFVMPSLYEGFGLPPLEAAACGVPVLAARAGSLPEVLGDAASWFDPTDVDALAEGLARVVDDPALRATLRQRGMACAERYPWTATAQAMGAIYAQALGTGRRTSEHLGARRP